MLDASSMFDASSVFDDARVSWFGVVYDRPVGWL
jgi:hypothetical protein